MTGQRWFLGLVVSAGVVGAVAVGCGGKSQDGPELPAEDTGAPDTGIVVVKDTGTESGAADTAAKDTGDVPGSLFDASIPDVVFEGGKSSGACYDCIKDKCSAELTKCDADARCRGLTLCLLIECGGSTTDTTCLFGCALKYDVTSPSDPVATLALGVANCSQSKCTDKCPAAPDAGGGDAKPAEAGSGGGTPPSPGTPGTPGAPAFGKSKTVDPKVIEILSSINASYAQTPEASAGLVDALKSSHP